MRTVAILPVKGFSEAKQRLSERLASGSRRALAQAMFSDVLAALRHVQDIDAVIVVSADATAQAAAAAQRVTVVEDRAQAGQSPAAAIGIAHAIETGFDRAVLVPGDTPLLDPAELDDLLRRSAADGIAVAIVPDRHGTGTNALVLHPPLALAPSFGPGSLERHVQDAAQAGVSHRVDPVPSLAHDVDTPEDLADLGDLLEGRRGLAPMTRGALCQLGRSSIPGCTAPRVALAPPAAI